MSAAEVKAGASQPNGGDATQVIGNIVIPPCPRIVLAMVEEAHSDDPDFIKLDKLISGDMGLASAVIKTANSPYYGLNHKVLAVKTALHILGLGSVTNIVTLLALRNTLSAPGQAADPFWDQFWDRTNYHAIACARLARQLRFISMDGAYTFGLFNDCGIPLLVQRFANYKETLQQSTTAEWPLVDFEYERYQTTHAQVGAALARSWHLPELICRAIAEHHNYDLFEADNSAEHAGDIAALAAISLIADYLVNDFLGTPHDSEWHRHGAQALDYLGVEEDELDESKTDIFDELQEAQAYRR